MSDGKPADLPGRAAKAAQQDTAKAPPETTRAATDAAESDRAAGPPSAAGPQGKAGSPAGGTAGSLQPLIPADGKDEKAARVLQDRLDDSIGASGAGPAA